MGHGPAGIRIAGHDLLFPGALGFRLERGYRYAEVERTMHRVKTFRQNAREWARTAAELEEMAREAEKKGHAVTARDFFYRASIYYGRAQWSILRDNEAKRSLYDKCVGAYEGLIRHAGGLIERVVLDVEGERVFGVLHLPANRSGKVPAVLFFPGMDMFKEEFPNAESNPFARRGIAMLSLDGPGQGETRVKGCVVTDEKYVKAGKAALDYLQKRPEIDGDKLAVSGASFGSTGRRCSPPPTRASRRAPASWAILYSTTSIFELAPPSFKANFMYMAGISDEAAFDKMAAKMGLAGVGAKLDVPGPDHARRERLPLPARRRRHVLQRDRRAEGDVGLPRRIPSARRGDGASHSMACRLGAGRARRQVRGRLCPPDRARGAVT